MEMEDLYLYDLRRNDELMDVLSSSLEISASHIFIHNGSAEVIKSIFSILLRENDTVFIPEPGWSYYKSVADAKFAKCISYRVEEKGMLIDTVSKISWIRQKGIIRASSS